MQVFSWYTEMRYLRSAMINLFCQQRCPISSELYLAGHVISKWPHASS